MMRCDSTLGCKAKEFLSGIRGCQPELRRGTIDESSLVEAPRPGAVPREEVRDQTCRSGRQLAESSEKSLGSSRAGRRSSDHTAGAEETAQAGDKVILFQSGVLPGIENTSGSHGVTEGWKLPDTLDAWQPVAFGRGCKACDER